MSDLPSARAMLGEGHAPRFARALDGWPSRGRPGWLVYLACLRCDLAGEVYYGRHELEACLAERVQERTAWLLVAWAALDQLAGAYRKARGAGTLRYDAGRKRYEWKREG